MSVALFFFSLFLDVNSIDLNWMLVSQSAVNPSYDQGDFQVMNLTL